MTDYVVSSLIKKGNKILLIKRGGKTFNGFWAGVGGRIKKNETIKEAIIREVKEELGVKFIIIDELGFFEFLGKSPENKKIHSIHFGFEGKINGKIKSNKREVVDYNWFTYKETQKLRIMPNYRHFLKKLNIS